MALTAQRNSEELRLHVATQLLGAMLSQQFNSELTVDQSKIDRALDIAERLIHRNAQWDAAGGHPDRPRPKSESQRPAL